MAAFKFCFSEIICKIFLKNILVIAICENLDTPNMLDYNCPYYFNNWGYSLIQNVFFIINR